MILNSEKEMHIACDEWLQVRKHCSGGSVAKLLDEYCATSERLFAAFVRDFGSEDFTFIARAFRSFRGKLVETSEGPRAYPAWWPERNLRITE